ncbi:hypothetical protein AB4Z38_16715 [Arthrobacter sp. 2RAF6]|uniref:hypothetical protein n=1 Tax=Arthrobacter sp. 2RAF6 TaxID=3233002 RepID=UPI003F926F1D
MAAHNLRILENNPGAGARNGMPATGRHIVTDIYGSLPLRDLKAKSRAKSWAGFGRVSAERRE